ncbi:hypothetical protein [Streptomyces sp. NPDC053367]
MTAEAADVSVVAPARGDTADVRGLLTRAGAAIPAGPRAEVVLGGDTRR